MKLVFRKKLLLEKLPIEKLPKLKEKVPLWVEESDGLEVINSKVVGTGLSIAGKHYEYEVLPEWCEVIGE